MKNNIFLFDKRLREKFCLSDREHLCGVDEVGYGAIAGPLVIAAVIFSEKVYIPDLQESKSVSPINRELLLKKILLSATEISCHIVPTKDINILGLAKSHSLALKECIKKLKTKIGLLIIDGNKKYDIDVPYVSIVKADKKSAVVAAASIVAKIFRDRIIYVYHHYIPSYDFLSNKGYASLYHRKKIKEIGICELHRNYAFKFVL